MKFGAAQMSINHLDVEDNLLKAESMIEKASNDNCDIISFPELFLTGPLKGRESEYAQQIPGEYSDRICSIAAKNSLYIVMGSIIEKKCGKYYNTSILIDDRGQIIGRYRKIKLWNGEKKYITPGNDLPVFETDLGKIGLLICWDLAFPELAKKLALQGAQLIFCPSYWLYGDKYGMLSNERDHRLVPDINTESIFVETCGRARAIENEVFFTFINGWGEVDVNGQRDQLIGKSQIASPFYGNLAEAENREELVEAEVDTHLLRLAEDVYQILKDSYGRDLRYFSGKDD